MSFFVRVLLAMLVACATAVEIPLIIDYDQLPSCAQTCTILGISELNCLPPAAPVSNNAIYLDCFCQSGYLRSLHASGEICNDVCTDEDDQYITRYYNTLCGAQLFLSTSSQTSLPAPTGSATASPSPPQQPAEPTTGEPWIKHGWKYLVAAAGVVAFLAVVLFGLIYCHVCDRKKSAPQDDLIPLRLLTTRSSSNTLRGRGQVSRLDINNMHSLRSPRLAGPLAASGSAHSFADSLRFYQEEQDEREARRAVVIARCGGQQSQPRHISIVMEEPEEAHMRR